MIVAVIDGYAAAASAHALRAQRALLKDDMLRARASAADMAARLRCCRERFEEPSPAAACTPCLRRA